MLAFINQDFYYFNNNYYFNNKYTILLNLINIEFEFY